MCLNSGWGEPSYFHMIYKGTNWFIQKVYKETRIKCLDEVVEMNVDSLKLILHLYTRVKKDLCVYKDQVLKPDTSTYLNLESVFQSNCP